MEARFAALEQRLLKDQEEKHAALVELLAKLQHPEQAGELGKLRRIVEERLIPGLEKVEGGQQGSQDAVQKLDLLMRGENEANKLIDGIVPGVEKVFRMVEKLDKKFEKETEKLKKIYFTLQTGLCLSFRHLWSPSLGLLGVFTQVLTLVPRTCRSSFLMAGST